MPTRAGLPMKGETWRVRAPEPGHPGVPDRWVYVTVERRGTKAEWPLWVRMEDGSSQLWMDAHQWFVDGWLEHVPEGLARSEGFAADRDRASSFWARGFRPVPADEVEPGAVIAYTNTWLGFPVGEIQTSTVKAVMVDRSGVVISHERHGDPSRRRRGEEVWVRPADNSGGE